LQEEKLVFQPGQAQRCSRFSFIYLKNGSMAQASTRLPFVCSYTPPWNTLTKQRRGAKGVCVSVSASKQVFEKREEN